MQKVKLAFFGTPEFAVEILDKLKEFGLIPEIVITKPDEPRGRKLVVMPPPIKVWAINNSIKFFQPENLKKVPQELHDFDLFIVAAYGKIIPRKILDLPKYGTLNVHPSLLPKYRGASPIQAAILNDDRETGVTIILLDEEMDHGPIVAQEKIELSSWQPTFAELEKKLAEISGKLLNDIIPKWLGGEVKTRVQDDSLATFTAKIEKEDGFIPARDLLDHVESKLELEIERKVRALNPNPGVYTILKSRGKDIRIKITEAKIVNDKLVIEKVLPEGRKEMTWKNFLMGHPLAEDL